MTKSQPLVLRILSAIYSCGMMFVDTVSATLWLAIVSVFLLAQLIAVRRLDNATHHLLLFAPRWALGNGIPLAVVAGYVRTVCWVYSAAVADSGLISAVAGSGFVAALIPLAAFKGELTMRRRGVVMPAREWTDAVRDSWDDFVTVLQFAVVACLVLRLPALIMSFSSQHRSSLLMSFSSSRNTLIQTQHRLSGGGGSSAGRREARRQVGFREACSTEWPRALAEPLFLPFALVLCTVTFWRSPAVYRLLRTSPEIVNGGGEETDGKEAHYWAVRRSIVTETLSGLLDAAVLVVAAPPLLLTVYRVGSTCRGLNTLSSFSGKRRVAADQLYNMLLDLPFILVGVFTLPFLHQAPAVLAQLGRLPGRSPDGARQKLLTLFLCACLDLVALTTSALVIATCYRLPKLVGILKSDRSPESDPFRKHVKVIEQALAVLVDCPYAFLFILSCIIACWRVPSNLHALFGAPHTAEFRRRLVVSQLGNGCMDAVCLLLAVPVLATAYRAGSLIKLWRKEQCEEGEWHRGVLHELKQLIVDAPFIVLGLVASLGVWRTPWFFSKLYGACSAVERRAIAGNTCLLVILDVPTSFAFIAVCISIWRAPCMLADLREERALEGKSGRFAMHLIVWAHAFRQFTVELPWILLQFAAVWRAPEMYRVLSAQHALNKNPAMCEQRYLTGLFFVSLAIVDIAAVLSAGAVVCTAWQASPMLNELNREALERRHYLEEHNRHFVGRFSRGLIPIRHLCLFIFDIPFICLVAVGSIAIWRITKMRKICSQEFTNTHTYFERLKAASKMALFATLVIPCVFLCILLLLSWRSRATMGLLKKAKSGGSTKTFILPILKELGQLFLDIPFILLSPLSLWRIPSIVWSCFDSSKTAADRRVLVLWSIVSCVLDVLSMAVMLAVCVIPWKTLPTLARLLSSCLESLQNNSKASQPPIVKLTKVEFKFPSDTDKHGMCFVLHGNKPSALTWSGLSLDINGGIWESAAKAMGAGAVSAGRMALLPLTMAKTNLHRAEDDCFEAGKSSFVLHVAVAAGYHGSNIRMSWDRLHCEIDRAITSGDGDIVFRFDFTGGQGDDCKASGVLTRFRVLPSQLKQNQCFELGTSDQRGSSLLLDLASDMCSEDASKPKQEDACPLHLAALQTSITAVASLPIELCCLCMCAAPPFLTMTSMLYHLFVTQSIEDQRKAAATAANDLITLVMGVVILGTIWRAPTLLHRTYRACFPKQSENTADTLSVAHQAWNVIQGGGPSGEVLSSKRYLIKLAVIEELKLASLDLMQGLQITFILLTVVWVPHFFNRFWKVWKLVAARNRAWATAGLQRLRKLPWRSRPDAGDAFENDFGDLGLQFQHLPYDVLAFSILPLLDAKGLCHMAGASQPYRLMTWGTEEGAGDSQYWSKLLQQEFGQLPNLGAHPKSLYEKALNERRQLSGAPPRPQEEIDLEQGMRFVIYEEFIESVRHVHHFLLLPLKLLAFPAFIVSIPLWLRYNGLRTRISDPTLSPRGGHTRHTVAAMISSLQVDALLELFYETRTQDDLQKMAGSLQCQLVFTGLLSNLERYSGLQFWALHWFPLATLCNIVLVAWNESARLMAVINCIVMLVSTFGWPLVLQVLPDGRGTQIITDIMAGVLLPFFTLFQIMILCTPLIPVRWWLFLPIDSWVSWAFSYSVGVASIVFETTSITIAAGIEMALGFVLPVCQPYAEWLLMPTLETVFGPWVFEVSSDQVVSLVTNSGAFNVANNMMMGMVANCTTGFITSAGPVELATAVLGEHPLRSVLLAPLQYIGADHIALGCSLFLAPFEALFFLQVSIVGSTAGWIKVLNSPTASWLADWLVWILTSRIILQCAWLLVMARCWWLTYDWLDDMMPHGVRPFEIYMWPLRLVRFLLVKWFRAIRSFLNFIWFRIILGAVRLYDAVLSLTSAVCFKMGVPGQLLLVPVVLVWMFWPCYVPLRSRQWTLIFTAGPMSLLNILRGKGIVQKVWDLHSN